MTKAFAYERFDVSPNFDCEGQFLGGVQETPDSVGVWVRAVDAIYREAVLQARIRELEKRLM